MRSRLELTLSELFQSQRSRRLAVPLKKAGLEVYQSAKQANIPGGEVLLLVESIVVMDAHKASFPCKRNEGHLSTT